MKFKRLFLIFVGVLLFTGCVSSKEYKAKLADIDTLKEDVSTLQEKLKGAESELSNLQEEKETLAKDRDELLKENADLKSLLEAKKDELLNEINSLRMKLFDKESEIKGIKDELRSRDIQVAELKTEIEDLSHERSKAIEEKEKAISELKKTYNNLVVELKDEIKKGEIAVTQLRDKLSLSMVEKILFDSGSAEVKKEGQKVLDRVAEILKKISDKQIRIEGHTDNVPIGYKLKKKFPTNWELSAARATNVVRYLQENGGVDSKFLSAAGYAESKPIASNDTEEGKAKNRRIEIVLLPLDIDRIPVDIEKVPLGD
ncbi:MAG: OmpA family protein [Nitrospirota bacterium]